MSDSVSSFFSSVGLGGSLSNDIVPALGIGLAAFTGGASLALDAGTVAAADGIALSTYGVPAAQAMAEYGATAAELGLPEAATAADLGAVAGTASGEFASTAAGQEALAMTAQAGAPAAAQTAQTLASQLGYSDPIAAIAGGVNPADLGMVQSGAGGLSNLLGYAKTGAQLVGGIGQLAKGAQLLGGAGKVSPQQADPFSQYRSGLAAQLNNLLINPSTVTSTPGYQFNLSQGLQGLQAQQAAQGRLVSGGALLQGQQYGQNLAQQTYQQQLQNLASLSGATQSPATGATTQQQLGFGNVGAGALGLQQLGAGAAGVLNPLATLYSQYNTPSPSVS
jgi:hypothetical protein